MRRHTVMTLMLVAALCVSISNGQQADERAKAMRQKLTHAQAAVEGIATEDFDKVRLNAVALIALTDHAAWRPLEKPEYLVYSSEFRAAAEALKQHAERKEADAATLAYVRLTLSCVNCHKHIRDARRAHIDVPDLPVALAACTTRPSQGERP